MKQLVWAMVLAGSVWAQGNCPPEALQGVENESTTGFSTYFASAENRVKFVEGIKSRITTDYQNPQLAQQDWSPYIAKALATTNDHDFYDAVRAWIKILGDKDGVSEFYSLSQLQSYGVPTYGIGVYLATDSLGHLFVTRITEGSPAEKGGVRPRDQILAIDGDRCVSILKTRGPRGSTIKLTLQSAGEPPREVSLIRGSVSQNVPFIAPKRLAANPEVGYWWIPQFIAELTSEKTLSDTLTQFESASKLSGLVLDLRGGFYGGDSALEALLGHLAPGQRYSLALRGGNNNRTINPRKPDWSGLPLAVLIDTSSHSIAPWIAAMLQKRGKTVVIGQPTRAFSFSSRSMPLEGRAEVDLAIAQIRFGDGTPLLEGQIMPSVVIKEDWLTFKEADDPYIKAALEALQKLK